MWFNKDMLATTNFFYWASYWIRPISSGDFGCHICFFFACRSQRLPLCFFFFLLPEKLKCALLCKMSLSLLKYFFQIQMIVRKCNVWKSCQKINTYKYLLVLKIGYLRLLQSIIFICGSHLSYWELHLWPIWRVSHRRGCSVLDAKPEATQTRALCKALLQGETVSARLHALPCTELRARAAYTASSPLHSSRARVPATVWAELQCWSVGRAQYG